MNRVVDTLCTLVSCWLHDHTRRLLRLPEIVLCKHWSSKHSVMARCCGVIDVKSGELASLIVVRVVDSHFL